MSEFKIKYAYWLYYASIFYCLFAFYDFLVTMYAYNIHGQSFFTMEMNPIVNALLKDGIPPIHMIVIPLIILPLSIYVIKVTKLYDRIESNMLVIEIAFAILMIVQMGIIHAIGFLSWFYYSAI